VIVVRIIWEFRRLGALRLSILSTVLVFVIIPVGVIALVASLVFAGGDKTQRAPRYRPGRQYDFQPIWFLAAPEQVTAVGSGPALGGAAAHAAPAISATVYEDSTGAPVRPGPTGGASDSW
jgi:hypothetical protein